MPLKPGTRFVYEGGAAEDNGTLVPHRVVINITDLTKVIAETSQGQPGAQKLKCYKYVYAHTLPTEQTK